MKGLIDTISRLSHVNIKKSLVWKLLQGSDGTPHEVQTWTPKYNITVAVLMKQVFKGHPYRGPGHKEDPLHPLGL